MRYDISSEEYHKGRDDWPLQSCNLREAVYDFFCTINIDDTEKCEYSYLYNTEYDHETEKFQVSRCIYPYTTYKATIRLNPTQIEAIEWAATYRTPREKGFSSNQMQNEVWGFLREVFICKLFEGIGMSRSQFWDNFVFEAGKKDKGDYSGDDGWDTWVQPHPNGKKFFIDCKSKSRSGINLRDHWPNDDFKEGQREVLIAPVEIKMEGDDILHFSFYSLLDTEKFWNFEESIRGIQLIRQAEKLRKKISEEITAMLEDEDLLSKWLKNKDKWDFKEIVDIPTIRVQKGETEDKKISRYVKHEEVEEVRLPRSLSKPCLDVEPRFKDLLEKFPLFPLMPMAITRKEMRLHDIRDQEKSQQSWQDIVPVVYDGHWLCLPEKLVSFND